MTTDLGFSREFKLDSSSFTFGNLKTVPEKHISLVDGVAAAFSFHAHFKYQPMMKADVRNALMLPAGSPVARFIDCMHTEGASLAAL